MSSAANVKSPHTGLTSGVWLNPADVLMMFEWLPLHALRNDLIRCHNLGACEASGCDY